jgi:2-keto-4-pentenoate hydratase
LTLGLLVLFSSCSRNENQVSAIEKDITNQLAADAQDDAIVDHLLAARTSGSVTRALALYFPDLDREKAYRIQMALLAKMEARGERVVGWKMGGTKISEPGKGLDPIFGFMLASNEFKSGSILKSDLFAAGTPLVEAEVCFWLKHDLPGPEVTREELKSAIAGVGGASELISVRVRDAQGGIEAGVNLGITDGLSHGGFILPEQQFPLAKVDFSAETGRVEINGEVRATGAASQMMNGAPLDAVLALANELPKHGRHLRAGDVVIIGSMLESPPAKAGDHAAIIFSSFGSLDFNLE